MGTGGCAVEPEAEAPEPVEQAVEAVVSCFDIPWGHWGMNDGCDCPADGNTTCDSDCASGNGAGKYCGCDFCHPEEPGVEPPVLPANAGCDMVPGEHLGTADGCDCPVDGTTACDPDCAAGNGAEAYCGCDRCYPETAPPSFGTPLGDHAPSEDPFTAPNSGLSNTCATVAPNQTLAGRGSVVTNASYGTSACWRGYVLDIDDYDAENTHGTLIGYNEPTPTTLGACVGAAIRAQVWRRNGDGSRSYLGQVRRVGEWKVDPWGRQYCQMPVVNVEEAISGFTPGGDYRIAMRAYNNNLARKKLVVSTLSSVAPETPLKATVQLDHALDSVAFIQAMPATHPTVVALDVFKRSTGTGTFCRTEEIRLSLLDLINTSLVKLGVPASVVNEFMTRNRAVSNGICGWPQSALLDWTTLRANIIAGIDATSDLFSAVAEITGGSLDHGTAVLELLTGYTLGALAKECGTNAAELEAFMVAGVRPGNKTGTQLLFGTCGANVSAVSNALGVASLPATVGQQIETCMNDILAEQQTCSDPHAQGAPDPRIDTGVCPECEEPEDDEEGEGEQLTPDDQLLIEITNGLTTEINLNTFIRDAKKEQVDGPLKIFLTIAEVIEDESNPFPGPEIIITDPRGRAAYEIYENVKSVIEFVTKILTIHGEDVEARRREQFWKQELENQMRKTDELCRALGPRAPDQCSRRCPEFDFGNLNAFYTTHDPTSGLRREVNQMDRVNHCLCQHVGDRLIGGGCETAEDRERQECLRNPDEPDGKPKLECLQHLQPIDLDMSATRARMCQYLRPACDGFADYLTEDRECGCGSLPFGDATREQFCPNIDVTDCGPDSVLDLKTCKCQGLGTGQPGYGTQGPGCRLDPANFGANVRPMLTVDPNVLLTDALVTANGLLPVIRTEPGFQSFATGPLRIRDFPRRLGNSITVDMHLPTEIATLNTGRTLVNVSVISADHDVASMINAPIGVIQHNTLTPGVVQRKTLTIPTAVRQRLAAAETAGENVHFIFVNDTPANLPTTPGIASLNLSGTTRPAAELSPICVRPGPTPTPLPIGNPDTLTNPLVLAVPNDLATRWLLEGL